MHSVWYVLVIFATLHKRFVSINSELGLLICDQDIGIDCVLLRNVAVKTELRLFTFVIKYN